MFHLRMNRTFVCKGVPEMNTEMDIETEDEFINKPLNLKEERVPFHGATLHLHVSTVAHNGQTMRFNEGV